MGVNGRGRRIVFARAHFCVVVIAEYNNNYCIRIRRYNYGGRPRLCNNGPRGAKNNYVYIDKKIIIIFKQKDLRHVCIYALRRGGQRLRYYLLYARKTHIIIRK